MAPWCLLRVCVRVSLHRSAAISGSRFTRCAVTAYGGAVYCAGHSRVEVGAGSNFTGNRANFGGALAGLDCETIGARVVLFLVRVSGAVSSVEVFASLRPVCVHWPLALLH